MKNTELMDFLNELEEKLPVHEWTLHGFRVWPLVRIELGLGLDDFLPHPRPSALRRLLPEPLKALARAAKSMRVRRRARRHNEAAERADVGHTDRPDRTVDALFLTMTTARRFRLRGGHYCTFSDPIADLLEARGRSSFVLEYAPGGEYRLPRYRRSLLVQRDLDELASCELEAHRGASTLARDERFRALEEEVLRRGGRPAVRASSIGIQALRIRRWADFFKRHLEVLRPSIALTFGWYDPEGMALGLACRELGIRSIDVQHGVQGALHVAYGRWSRVPESGYELLPDLFWTWSEEEVRTIREWNGRVKDRHEAVAVGNVLMDAFAREDTELAAHFGREIDAASGAGEGPRVLVALGRVGGLPPLLQAVIAAAPPSWRWWIRVHPGSMDARPEIEGTLRGMTDRSVTVGVATDAPLYALLPRTDVLLTEVSSVVLEARLFGVRSVLTHATGAEYYRAEVSSGWARVAHDVPGIVDAIAAQAATRASARGPAPTLDPDGLARILSLLRPRA